MTMPVRQFVLSCQLWRLSDNFSQLHGQAGQLRSENAHSGCDAEETDQKNYCLRSK